MSRYVSLLLGFLFFLTACGSAPKRTQNVRYQKGSLTTRYYPDGRYNSIDDIIYDTLEHHSGSGVYYSHQLGTSKSFDIPFTDNEYVEKWVDYFTGQGREHFARYLARLGRFMPYIQAVLAQYNLPHDIVFLSMIESGFNIRAQSWASAAGPWQFIRSTGALYGLEVDYYIDERRDVEKSTHAAARHLKDLYQEFGDWYLAFAAYNAGAGKIHNAIDRDGSNFWDMVQGHYLRQETKDYVPKILAAAMIAKNPEKYGFNNVPYQTPIAFERVTLGGPTDMDVAAECAGVDPDLIRLLNPELLQDMTPPNIPNYSLKVPKGTAVRFQKHYASLRPSDRIRVHYYTAAKGDSVQDIAQEFGVSVSELAKANSGQIDVDKHNYSKKMKVSYRERGKTRSKWVKQSYSVASYSVSPGARLVIPTNRSLASYSSSRDDEAAYRARDQFGIQVAQLSKDTKKGSKKKDKKNMAAPIEDFQVPEAPVSDVAVANPPQPEGNRVAQAEEHAPPTPTNFDSDRPAGAQTANAPSDAELREAVAQLPAKSDLPDVESDPHAPAHWKEAEATESNEAEPHPKSSASVVKSQPKAPVAKAQFYKVRRGDSVAGIAKKNGVSVAQLKEWNGKKVSPHLITGANIQVAGGTSVARVTNTKAANSKTASNKVASAKVVKYKVKRGDNLLKIAKANDTTPEDIQKLNGLKSHVIKPGAVLVVRRP
jgi:LysM repeat protein